MPTWTVQLANGEDELVEAGLLATESGALVALTDEGSLRQAWAPGQWRTVRQVGGVDGHPAGRRRWEEAVDRADNVLLGFPRG
jgi:hypothetical protein